MRFGRAELVFFCNVQHQLVFDVGSFVQRFVYANTVVGHADRRVGAARSQVSQFAAQTKPQYAGLSLHLGHGAQGVQAGLYVFHAFGFVEALVKTEGALPVFRRVTELHAGLLTPEQIGHQHDIPFLRVIVSDFAHGNIDAENFLRNHQARSFTAGGQRHIALKRAAFIVGFDVHHACCHLLVS